MIVAVLALSAGGWWLASRDAADGTSPPLLVEVVRGDIEDAVTAGGTIKPSTIVEVGAQASGQLENTARVRQVRRDIARIKTILGERKAAEA